MNASELTMLISSISVLISNEITNDAELAIWGSSFTRLGNTLTAISAQRVLIKKVASSSESKNAAPASDNGPTSCKAPSDNPQ